jgi:hypothetical protein
MSGCMKAAIILFVLAVVAVVVFVAFIGSLVNNFAGIGGNGAGIGGGGGVGGGDCPFLSDADARTVFGGDADAIELSGLYDASIGIIIDKRVLANAPDCWVTEGNRAYIARIAVYQAGDAGSVYETERTAAEPTSEDQGGGVSLENPGYFAGEVAGLGDEAFCTDLSATIMAGVAVHQGDRMVYVSVGPASEDQPIADAAELCSFAQEVAATVLR